MEISEVSCCHPCLNHAETPLALVLFVLISYRFPSRPSTQTVCTRLIRRRRSLKSPPQVSVANATSLNPTYPYTAGPAAQGLSWYVTFPPTSGDVSSMIVSTGNGPASVPGSPSASAGTLSGTDPIVSVREFQQGGLHTSIVTPEGELEAGTAYSVRVKAYNDIGWSEVNSTVCLVPNRIQVQLSWLFTIFVVRCRASIVNARGHRIARLSVTSSVGAATV